MAKPFAFLNFKSIIGIIIFQANITFKILSHFDQLVDQNGSQEYYDARRAPLHTSSIETLGSISDLGKYEFLCPIILLKILQSVLLLPINDFEVHACLDVQLIWLKVSYIQA